MPRRRKQFPSGHFLRRPLVFWVPFTRTELVKFRSHAQLAGLSQVEYARRKILHAPMATVGVMRK